jgi:hypothetical protein
MSAPAAVARLVDGRRRTTKPARQKFQGPAAMLRALFAVPSMREVPGARLEEGEGALIASFNRVDRWATTCGSAQTKRLK